MKVLIAVSSRHGGTHGIADALAVELRRHDLSVDVCDAKDMPRVESYDAVVLGSAVYMGNWLPDARRFWEANRADFATRPLWLFSSGPIGADDPKPHGVPEGIRDILEASGAREHKVFAGVLDMKRLGIGERILCKAMHAPEGDFRDFTAVCEWARDIAGALSATTVARWEAIKCSRVTTRQFSSP